MNILMPFLAVGTLANTLVKCLFMHPAHVEDKNAKQLIIFMENTQDARQIGTMLNLYDTVAHTSVMVHQARKASKEAVARLLPLLKPEDADTLNTQQRARIRRDMFVHGFNVPMDDCSDAVYCLLVLSALEQIGDRRDLSDVERLIKKYYTTDKVRAAADQCVQVIKERIAYENLKDVLLRPDHNPDAPATLLRALAERADSAPQQLLRASASDDTESPV